ncbi:hypothetical protein [Sediminibacter sp. Hel_I_10]|uniref:hypothetical protein n=1 Tax=Sediminibacter sp. Hel_I_10 TaxID=1392490 RepID=UPI000478D4D8|nr:hypothetical protein [Sediminibacter sp. Hel_I_10]
MKKPILNLALAIALVVSVSSCRETKEGADNAADAVENSAEDAAEATEGALEKAGKAIDNAVEETKEAGEAVEQAVDSIDGENN